MDSTNFKIRLAFLLGFAWAVPAAASEPPGTSPSPSFWRQASGLVEVEGELRGAGSDYKVRFGPGGFEFTPAFGKAAERSFPLAFSLESIRRGASVIYDAPEAGVAPVREGTVATYVRGGRILESYEVRPEGIEQTFRFESLPPGMGDLVVRGRITTGLSAVPEGETAERIRFETEGLGGVTFGAVTGIDAKGRKVSGSLRLAGASIELVLPDSELSHFFGGVG